MIGLVVLAPACGGSDPDIATSTSAQLPADADPTPEWGPMAIAPTTAPGAELIAGILEISDDCVVLNERGHRQVMLGWPKDRSGWNSNDSTIKFTTGAGPVVELRDQDRVTLSGTLLAGAPPAPWPSPPGVSCPADAVWQIDDIADVVSPAGIAPPHEGPIGGGR